LIFLALQTSSQAPTPRSWPSIIGHRRAGWAGLIVAGSCFILPAALIVGVISWAYVRFGSLPQSEGILYGIKPVVLAIIVQAIWRLARPALKTRVLLVVGTAAFILGLSGVNELIILFGTGILAHSQCSGEFPGRCPRLRRERRYRLRRPASCAPSCPARRCEPNDTV
jgi:chromate transport protein ChrA